MWIFSNFRHSLNNVGELGIATTRPGASFNYRWIQINIVLANCWPLLHQIWPPRESENDWSSIFYKSWKIIYRFPRRDINPFASSYIHSKYPGSKMCWNNSRKNSKNNSLLERERTKNIEDLEDPTDWYSNFTGRQWDSKKERKEGGSFVTRSDLWRPSRGILWYFWSLNRLVTARLPLPLFSKKKNKQMNE